MAWTNPRTWLAGETVTAALLNIHVRDNLMAIGNLQSGTVTITPVANTVTTKAVTFPTPFATVPVVVISANTSVPGTTVQEVGAFDITTTGFTASIYRTNTTDTPLSWIANTPS